ncbi:hypothetical protein [Hymenobacter sp. BRD128]|uniref:hypothetical protein n=1 Tax=Hymenobacter sp. BRD128 TaxID=2675878 RepID=UPI0020B67D9D|nr:hypothetical protein [Hymenobacter sp. BRD128]
MNLALFFDPLPDELTAPTAAPTTVAAYVARFAEDFPDWRTADLALIGLDEWRGTAAGAPRPGSMGLIGCASASISCSAATARCAW